MNGILELIKYTTEKKTAISNRIEITRILRAGVRNVLVIYKYLSVAYVQYMALPVHAKWWAWVRQRVLLATLLTRPSIKRVNVFESLALWECIYVWFRWILTRLGSPLKYYRYIFYCKGTLTTEFMLTACNYGRLPFSHAMLCIYCCHFSILNGCGSCEAGF